MLKKFFKKRSGFTLSEVMVVIGITLLLSSLAIGYNRSSEKQLRVYKDQATIVSVLNQAKALSLERFNQSSTDLVCGVGVKFEAPNSFYLFQDIVSEGEETCSDSDKGYSGSGETIRSFSLGEQVKFSSSMSEDLDILFLSPHLDVVSSGSFPVTIEIESISDSDVGAVINVSGAGQITTQEVN